MYIKIKHEINYNTGLVIIIIMPVSLKCFLLRITGFRAIYNFCTVHSETQRQDGYPLLPDHRAVLSGFSSLSSQGHLRKDSGPSVVTCIFITWRKQDYQHNNKLHEHSTQGCPSLSTLSPVTNRTFTEPRKTFKISYSLEQHGDLENCNSICSQTITMRS